MVYEGKENAEYLVLMGCTFVLGFAVLLFSFHGQVISKAKKYKGFAIILLFIMWFVLLMTFLVLFIDQLIDTNGTELGPVQQLAIVSAFFVIFVTSYLYTMIKFPEFKDVEYIKKVIDKRVERAIKDHEGVCDVCGSGIRNHWEYCPSCGAVLVDEETLVVDPILEEEPPSVMPPVKEPSRRKGLLGRFKKKDKKETMVIEEPEVEEEPDMDEPDQEPEEAEKTKKADAKADPQEEGEVARVECDNCGTLLEIRNPKRPLNVRCPSCSNIWLLEE